MLTETILLLIIPLICVCGCLWNYIKLMKLEDEDESERYDFFEEQICRTTERLMEGGTDE